MKTFNILPRKDYNNTCGIYFIKNTINNKIYIGSSVNIYRRVYDHFNALENNRHHSSHLQKSFNKYGDLIFISGVLEKCFKEELNQKESYYINLYKSHLREFGYNMSLETNNGRVVSEDTKKSLSAKMKGYRMDKAWEKQKEMRLAGIPHHSLGRIISKKEKEKRSFTISNYTNNQKAQIKENKQKGYLKSSKKQNMLRSKKCALLDLSGNIIKIYNSVKEITDEYPFLVHSQITKICRGVRKKKEYKGFSFKYINEDIV